MSWLFSRALVEAYSEGSCSDGELSVPLSGNATQQAYCAPDKMMGFSRLSRFGMTYKPLTADRGEALLTLFLAAFPARTSVQQEKEQALTENDQACGDIWRGWLAKYDRDSCLWRTAQCSLLEDLNESLETLPRSGMTRNGLLWEQPTLALRIRGTEFGLWPTPTVNGNYNRKGLSLTSGDGLATAVIKRMWPTPVCQDSRHAKTRHLNPKCKRWTTNLGEVVMSLECPPVSGSLNPMWVEWLMGWPLAWTDLRPLEMDKFLCVPQQHGRC